jgi:hypothetical protein
MPQSDATRLGLIDRGRKAHVRNLLRTDTPMSFSKIVRFIKTFRQSGGSPFTAGKSAGKTPEPTR